MNKMLAVMIAAASLIALPACQPGGSDGKAVEKTAPTPAPTPKNDTDTSGLDSDPNSEFQIIIEKTYDSQARKVDLIFKPNLPDLKIISVTKSNNDLPTESFSAVTVRDSSEVTDYLDSEANDIAPWNYTYAFELSHPSFKNNEKITKVIFQKKDLIVNSQIKLSTLNIGSNDLQLGTIKLSDNSILTLDKPSLRIYADELVAGVNSSIENMTKEEAVSAAKDGEPGKNGGAIRIVANRAEGELQIFLRGGKGGKGIKGIETIVKGADGANGAPGTRKTMRAGRGSTKFDGPPADDIVRCDVAPQPGQPGQKGSKGGNGSDGGRGGETGSLDLTVKTGNIKYVAQIIPGAGGDRGEGGKGGPSGNPGQPGDNLGGLCPAAPPAGQIPSDPGDPGNPGPEGAYGSFCVSRENSNFSCSQNAINEGVL